MKAFSDKIIVKILKEEEKKTPAGLVIPAVQNNKQEKAEVIQVGPGTERYKMETKVGDILLLPKNTGIEFEVEGETYRTLPENNALCILNY